MEVQSGATDPGTGNQQGLGTPENGTGDLFHGLFADASDKGSQSPADANLHEGSSAAAKDSAPAQSTPSAQDKPASVAPWRKQLKADLQSEPRLDRFNEGGFDAVSRAYLELEGKLGSAIIPPGKDAKPEDWQAFYKKIGRPDTPDEYTLEDIVLPAGIEQDPNGVADFKKLAHSLGLSNAQAKRLYMTSVQKGTEYVQSQQKAQEAAASQCDSFLKDTWKDKYGENLELARRVVKAHGSDKLLANMRTKGVTTDPDFMVFLAKVGREMREDTLLGENSPSSTQINSPAGGAFKYPGL